MLTNEQCQSLRDELFADGVARSASELGGADAPVYRYATVLPGGEGVDATLVVALAPGVSTPGGADLGSPALESWVREHVSASDFAKKMPGLQLNVVIHDYLRSGWPYPWAETAKASFNAFPTLVLMEQENGKVHGVLMENAHFKQTEVAVASSHAEPDEVLGLLAQLQGLPQDAPYGAWYKACNLAFDSLDAAIANTPETEAGQKEILIYRQDEWFSGIWNNPAKPNSWPLEFMSMADFHGTRVSEAKLKRRPGLDAARSAADVVGDYDVLRKAIKLIRDPMLHPEHNFAQYGDFEQNAAVKLLADWWNSCAPETERQAAFCRLYVWDDENRMFLAMDPEEPAASPIFIAKSPSVAFFERPGHPTVVGHFFRGKASNLDDGGVSTVIYFANGETGWERGLEAARVDEAYYCAIGLSNMAEMLDASGDLLFGPPLSH